MNLLLILPVLITAFLSFYFTPKWIKKCRDIDMLWEDMNDYKRPRNVAASGGLVTILSFIIGVMVYIAIKTFIDGPDSEVSQNIFALGTSILILALVGLTDDLLGWKKGGLSKRYRIILVLIASIPLAVINSGEPNINLPFLGRISLGLIYPLLVIPIGMVGATTTYNFLAGFRGLETGQGIIILSFLSLVSYATGSSWLALIGLIMVSSLIGFYYFNKIKKQIFPGDILTYSIGALIAGMAILGNFEKIALFIFIPYVFEVILKLRGRLQKHSFGKPNKDNSLEMPYEKIYGMTHVSLWILKRLKQKVYEKDVVYLLHAFQIIVCLFALVIFKNSIFPIK